MCVSFTRNQQFHVKGEKFSVFDGLNVCIHLQGLNNFMLMGRVLNIETCEQLFYNKVHNISLYIVRSAVTFTLQNNLYKSIHIFHLHNFKEESVIDTKP